MNIVVLDGHTLNPGDLSWAELEKLGTCRVFDRTAPEEVLERAKDADILITNKVVIGAMEIEQLRNLKYIGLSSTGYNVVDIEAAAKRFIPVLNVPAYSTLSVAQLTFAHILNLCHHVAEHSNSVKNGNWSKSPDFCYWNFPLVELEGLTLGIIGFGRIGRSVAAIAEQFGMEILIYDIAPSLEISTNLQKVTLETLFQKSDIITLHCPLTSETEHIVDKNYLSMMKVSAFLINTSRGALVHEQDLADALNFGKIAAAGLDVLSTEPPSPDNLLLSAKNCYISPHIAWATTASRQRLMDVVVNNVRAFLDGKPINVVNDLK
ncbi:D-2-hydroxyacid dehydrogenase [bacterium]|nr:D-2-hydroxyacid dehydrogenase [bacterium]MBU1065881.1 D-2-hydroxyacid dehydrogenase [bacterium]MBU1635071.1 D-2-hydroxyacid dehydrogenase [bacterium]MBU1874480.1 D-2-hydroxyacid dehydrogenase [bacterium]